MSIAHTILVVEDNPDNQQLVTWILEDEGYTVVCADTAEDGLKLLESHNFTLILMDISLPGMDGKQATQQIRNTPAIASIPIIALTAHAVQGERESIMASGVDELLTKPLDEVALIQRIKEMINR
ncbi:response regulator [Saccharophagus degradans]|uniref:Response regulator receiver n=2 Tax=Saccharophagus degradans TaxID=86304 RepID=Q21PN5_SACD2|nr:response regulator [Saccharophagus degradans]ABD79344.1 response regulator receiver [Saccharophagus degradans 2-40]MBU2986759.1 response regulator [Saccharophagus degradans]MDO6422756.1 response regulator [Saccharophagus degradans]MDO6606229.1 response regulator [Saccharophagus degradans]WGO98477.1 response regulator [Saccharophagus degradans]